MIGSLMRWQKLVPIVLWTLQKAEESERVYYFILALMAEKSWSGTTRAQSSHERAYLYDKSHDKKE